MKRRGPPAGPASAAWVPGASARVRWAYLAALCLGGALLLWWAGRALLPLGFAAVLAYVLAPFVTWLEHRRIHRVVGILVSYALLGLFAVALALYLIPLAARQAGALLIRLPALAAKAQATWARYLAMFHQAPLPAALRGALNHLAASADARVAHALGVTLTAAVSVVPWVVAAAVAPVLAFYALKDARAIRARVWNVVPLDWQPAVFKWGRDLDRALGGYIRGQLLVALLVGLLAGIWSFALGIPFPVLIALAAAVTDVVPYIGPVVGALPAVALGLLQSPWTALYAALGFVAIHQVEGTVLGPQVVGEAVGLHPLVIVLVVLIGAQAAGLLGMVVAVPVAAALRITAEHLYRVIAQGAPRR